MNKRWLPLLCLLIVGCIAGCAPRGSDVTDRPEDDDDDPEMQIARIDVRHSSFGMTEIEYRIDLEDGSFWIYEISSDYENYEPRNSDAENEGFTLVSELSDEEVEDFLEQCDRYNIAKWKSQYMNDDICDGHQWGMIILFTDGTHKEISGSNAYPGTWDEMREAFEDLTGEDILSVSSYWLDN